jgi:hypothetical protein
MTQAVLPQMREQGSGAIVNVTSGVTFQPLPLMSIYTASKAAVNAFSESVALELAPLGIRVRIVISGRAPETPFGDNARGRMGLNIPDAYRALAAQMMARFGVGGDVTYSREVSRPYGAPPPTPPAPCGCQLARTPSPAPGPDRRLPSGRAGLGRLCANWRTLRACQRAEFGGGGLGRHAACRGYPRLRYFRGPEGLLVAPTEPPGRNR